MIPLQYVNDEGLVWLLRLADPFGFKGSGFGEPHTLLLLIYISGVIISAHGDENRKKESLE